MIRYQSLPLTSEVAREMGFEPPIYISPELATSGALTNYAIHVCCKSFLAVTIFRLSDYCLASHSLIPFEGSCYLIIHSDPLIAGENEVGTGLEPVQSY